MPIRNDSEVRYELSGGGSAEGVSAPEDIVLSANRMSLVSIGVAKEARPGSVRLQLPYAVSNLLVEPGTGLAFRLVVDVEVVAAEE